MMYYIKREKVARIIFDQRKIDKDSSHITIDFSEKPLSRRMPCLATNALFFCSFTELVYLTVGSLAVGSLRTE